MSFFLDAQGNLYGEHYWYLTTEEKFKNYIWKRDANGALVKIRDDQYGENTDFGFLRDSLFASIDLEAKDGFYELVRTDSASREVWQRLELNRPTWKFLTSKGRLLFVDFPSIYRADRNQVTLLSDKVPSSRFPFSLQNEAIHSTDCGPMPPTISMLRSTGVEQSKKSPGTGW